MKNFIENVLSSMFTFVLILIMFIILFIGGIGDIIYSFFDGDDKDEH